MPQSQFNVFLSSTARDLKDHREAVYRTIEGLDGYHCIRMEDFGARAMGAEEFCLEKITGCDLFIGIVGHLYGSSPENGETSYTEMEYDAAAKSCVPRLMFVAPDDFAIPASLFEPDHKRKKQILFRERVQEEQIRADFTSPDNLAMKVAQSIKNMNIETRTFLRRIPFQAPPLPEHFISRPEVKNAIKSRLFSSDHRPGTVVATAIYGMGGCGKTSMAIDLANDDNVKNHFKEGILWATLGQEPNLLSILNDWIEALSIELKPATTVVEGSKKLKDLINEKKSKLLLVIDDVWEEEHIKPLLAAGFPSHILITTRRPDVAMECGAGLFELGMMKPEESLQLFSSWLEYEPEDAEKAEALIVAKDVGYLALALKLVASRIKAGSTWKEIHNSLEQEMAHLEKLESPRHRKKGEMKLQASLNLSLKALYSYDREALKDFFWLGILPDDAIINAMMAANLWGTGVEKADEMLELLWSEALIIRDRTAKTIDKKIKAYYLHDLLHDSARVFLGKTSNPESGDLPGLELELSNANRLFLEKYHNKLQGNLWHTMNDDGYIFSHLTWHMQRADMANEIHNLMREQNSNGENGWYSKLESSGQMAVFVEDIYRAWKMAEKDSGSRIEMGEKASAIALEIRYALMASSLRSLSASIPPKLLLLLVKIGIWTPLQGLSYARQNPDPKDRCVILAKLSGYFGIEKSNILKEALGEASIIRDGFKRILTLAMIASFFSEPQAIINEALNLIMRISDNDLEKSIALTEIAPKFSDPQKAFSVAMMINNYNDRERILAEIVPRFTDPEEAFSKAMEIKEKDLRNSILPGIVLRFSNANDALSHVMTIDNSTLRYNLLYKIAHNLPDPQEAFSIAIRIGDNQLRNLLLSEIKPRIFDVKKVLLQTLKIEDDYQRDKVLTDIATILTDARDALRAANEIKYPYQKARFFIKIAHLFEDPREASNKALDAAKEIKSKSLKIEVLTEIAKITIDNQEVLNEAFATALNINDNYSRAQTLANIYSIFKYSNKILEEALMAAREIKDSYHKAEILAKIAPDLPNSIDILNEALKAAEDVVYYRRAEILLKIAPSFTDIGPVLKEVFLKTNYSCGSSALTNIILQQPRPREIIDQLLSAAREIADYNWRTDAFIYIASMLPDSKEIIKEAFSYAKRIEHPEYRDYKLAKIALLFGDPKEALSAIMMIQNYGVRAEVLSQIAPKYPDHTEISMEAVSSALRIEDKNQQVEAFCRIIPYHPDPMKVLSVTMKIDDEIERKEAQTKFSNYWPDSQNAYSTVEKSSGNEDDSGIPVQINTKNKDSQEVLDEIMRINDNYQKAVFLAKIASIHPNPQMILENALLAASNIDDDHRKAMALAEIALKLPDPKKAIEDALSSVISIKNDELRRKTIVKIEPLYKQLSIGSLYEIWTNLIHILAKRSRKELLPVLADLIPLIISIGDSEVMKEVTQAIIDVGRWWGSPSPYQDDDGSKKLINYHSSFHVDEFDFMTFSVDGSH